MMVAEGMAQYRIKPGAPGRLKLDERAILITREPRFEPARTVGPRDIQRAYVEKREYDRKRIELSSPRNPDAVGSCHGFVEVEYEE
jgi:hypothetical protein